MIKWTAFKEDVIVYCIQCDSEYNCSLFPPLDYIVGPSLISSYFALPKTTLTLLYLVPFRLKVSGKIYIPFCAIYCAEKKKVSSSLSAYRLSQSLQTLTTFVAFRFFFSFTSHYVIDISCFCLTFSLCFAVMCSYFVNLIFLILEIFLKIKID